ncbi:zinc metalloproteinase nas-13 [Sergentomyia squamirostris]
MKVFQVISILSVLGMCSALPFQRSHHRNVTGVVGPNPDEIGEFFEGDIRFTDNQQIAPLTGILDQYWRWENAVIPYVIAADFTASHRSIIQGAMTDIMASTCIRFVPRSTERDYVTIQNADSGCWSYIGRIRNAQILNLSIWGGCVSRGVATHELIHAIGFFHAQGDVNRDKYVKIHWENITPGRESNFEVYTNDYVTDYGEGYDYGSIMHYGPYAFTKNWYPTIEAIQPNSESMGQRNAMSQKDINKINKMYNC